MPTRVTFEPAVIADAIKKAARIAPTRGGVEMDKAAGVILDIDPSGEVKCVIRATDTMTFYLEAINVIEVDGDPVRWRLASQVVSGVMSSLAARKTPIIMSDGEGDNRVHIRCGSMKASPNLNPNNDYPSWDPSPSEDLSEVMYLGEALARVEWAAQKGGAAPYCGVLLDGKYLYATDRYRMARVPMLIPSLDREMLIPAWSLASVITGMGAVKVGRDGHLIVVEPNEYTQFKTLTYDAGFPANKYTRFDAEYDAYVTFSAKELVERINQASSFAGSDRDPIVQLFLGKGRLGVFMENAETGEFGDWILLPGEAKHDWCKIKFAPKLLLDCLTHGYDDKITLGYRPDKPNMPVILRTDGGYEVIVAPRKELSTT
jgi:DNA polymerase III sliding clamp (beta) subunit (PCNA family)